MEPQWALPAPFTTHIEVGETSLDGFGHVNNKEYIQWLETCMWQHSEALGIPLSRCLELNRGMAIRRTEVDYLRAAFAGDRLIIGTWITHTDRLKSERKFEIFRLSDGVKLLQAKMDFVCINLQTGAPTRLPEAFVKGYRPLSKDA